MTPQWFLNDVSEGRLAFLAECLALKVRPGDAILLHGDLGAGKTAFARALVRALIDEPSAEVPSPTFPILQVYEGQRLTIAHLDLYRLSGPGEIEELGLGDLSATGALVVEWPERAGDLLGPDALDIHIGAGTSAQTRSLRLAARGTWGPRLARAREIMEFLESTPWQSARVRYLQGDASTRAYARLSEGPKPALLMDWPRQPDGPPIRDGLPYSRIAHLAEATPAFVEVQRFLLSHGLRVPEIWAEDLDRGFLVTEDLGDRVFGREVASGTEIEPLWRKAVDEIILLRGHIHRATPGHSLATIEDYDKRALSIETELLVDWYWPMLKGAPVPDGTRDDFLDRWSPVLDSILAAPKGLVLRDFHSPNLIWLASEGASGRVGLIDFQDAVNGNQAYDVVSLLQDARLDVPADTEARLLAYTIGEIARREPGFDADQFRLSYAAMGAQRNTKILGIFARLARRDGKTAYLTHIPRIWRYLERDLAHPQLAHLRGWYDDNFAPEIRACVLEG